MRVWDIHPGYLSRESLLGQHVEIHAIFSVISGDKKGYAHHPETVRWRHNLYGLKQMHDLTVREMDLRSYGHRSPLPELDCTRGKSLDWVDPPQLQFGLLKAKYAAAGRKGRIPLPERASQFWSHHKYAVMGRGYGYYKDIQTLLHHRKDRLVREEEELVVRVLAITCLSMQAKALRNTVDHIWGYFKNIASIPERELYLKKREPEPASLLPFLYELACKYENEYLIHSTIFADVL